MENVKQKSPLIYDSHFQIRKPPDSDFQKRYQKTNVFKETCEGELHKPLTIET